jgi:hypothetical protein
MNQQVADKLVCMIKDGHARIMYLCKFEQVDGGYRYAFSPSRNRAQRVEANEAVMILGLLEEKTRESSIHYGVIPA